MNWPSRREARLDVIACVRTLHHGDHHGLRLLLESSGDPLEMVLQSLQLTHVLAKHLAGEDGVDNLLDSILDSEHEAAPS